MDVIEPEVLPAVVIYDAAALLSHAACGYTLRGAASNFSRGTEAFCGEPITVPLRREEGAAPCQACARRATAHASRCDCFKLWPGGRLPDGR